MKRRIISIVTVLAMVITMMPAFSATAYAAEDGWYIVKKMNSFVARMNTSGSILEYKISFSCDVNRGNRTVMLLSVPEKYTDTLTNDEMFGQDNLSNGTQYRLPEDPVTGFIGAVFNPSDYEGVLSNEVNTNFPVSDNISVTFNSMKLYSDQSKGLDTDKSYSVFFVLRTPWDGSKIFRNTGYNNVPVATLLPVTITLKKQNLNGTYTDTVVKSHVVEGSNLTYDTWPVADIAGDGYFINTAKSTGAGTVVAQTGEGSMANSNRKAQDVVIYYDLIKTDVASITKGETTTGYETVQLAVNAAESGDTVVMIADSTENVTVAADDNLTLDLNGYVLTGTGSGSVITNNGTLTIQNSEDSSVHNFRVGANGLWTLTSDAKTVDYEDLTDIPAVNTVVAVKGGCITGASGGWFGGGIYSEGGTVIIKSGNIIGNSSNYVGGAVCVHGSVGTVEIQGGILAGNRAKYGACVSTEGASQQKSDNLIFKMTGGQLCFNTAFSDGGATFTYGKDTITGTAKIMYNQTLEGAADTNKNRGAGGLIATHKLSVSGNAEICGNKSAYGHGGGVYFAGTVLTLGGNANISGNKVNNLDNNLYLPSGKTVIINSEAVPATMSVGVTLANGTGDVTSAASGDYSQYFTSDANYVVCNKGSGSNQQVCLAEPEAKLVKADGSVTYYLSIVDACAEAPDDSTVYVLKDISGFTKKGGAKYIAIKHNITLDLNGHTLSGEDIVNAFDGAVAKVKNGTLIAPNNSSCVGVDRTNSSRPEGTLYVEDVKFCGFNAFYATCGHTYLGEGITTENLGSLYSSYGTGILHVTDGVYVFSKVDATNTATRTDKLFISGGCFSQNVSNYILPGYEAAACSHGRTGYYDVKPKDTEIVAEVIHNDAQGTTTTKFGKLADAIKVTVNGDTVRMLKDITENATIPAGKNIILDLNGKLLKATGENNRPLTVNGTLTIVDGNPEAVHYFTKGSFKGSYYILSSETTETVVNGGIIYGGYHTSDQDAGGGNVIVNNGGLLKMTAGSVVGGRSGAQAAGVCVVSGGTMELSGTGNIEGNAGAYGAGFSNWGTVKMSGGTVQNNAGERCSAVINYGTFEMTGGSIINNTSKYEYPVQFHGTTVLLGGEISGNNSTGTTVSYGGAVYSGGSLTVGGSILIDNNFSSNGTECNLFVGSNKSITVSTAKAPTTMSVGITTQTAPTKGSPVPVTGSNNSNYSTYFTSDNGNYKIYNTGSGSLQIVKLSVHEHTWSYSASGDTLKTWCTEDFGTSYCDYNTEAKAQTVTILAPARTTYGAISLSEKATLSGTVLGVFTLNANTIQYEGVAPTVYTKSTTAPTAAGTYKASITASEKTASVEYTIAKAVPTAADFSFNGTSATYDGSKKTATVTAKSGIVGMGTVTVEYYDGETKLDDAPRTVGTYTVKINVAEGSNYTSASAITATGWAFEITQETVTVSGTTVESKVYDANCDAQAICGVLNGVISGDVVNVTCAAVFATKNVGTGKDVNITYYLSGKDAGNYTISDESSEADITPAKISAKWTGITKVYSGAPLVPEASSFVGVFEGDLVSAAFDAANTKTDAGSYKLTAGLGGTDGGNYVLTNPNVNFVIEKAPVAFTVTGNTVVADGTPKAATVSATDNNGVAFTDFEVCYKNSRGELVEPIESGSYSIYAAVTGAAVANYRHAAGSDGSARKIGILTIYSGSVAPATYTIRYVVFEGSSTGTVADTGFKGGDSVEIADCSVTNPGYTFAGWKYNNKIYKAGESFEMPSRDVEFIADWTQNVYTIDGGIYDHNGSLLKDAVVSLMSGPRQVAQKVTLDDGTYSFNDVLPGFYNLVVSYDGIIVTTAVEISDQNITGLDVTLPSGRTNSVVEVAAGTPEVIVDGLEKSFDNTEGNYTPDDKAKVNAGGSAEFKLSVSENSNPDQEKLEELETKTSNAFLYLDIDLSKTIIDEHHHVTTTGAIYNSDSMLAITIPIPADMQGKAIYKVFRFHKDSAGDPEELTQLQQLYLSEGQEPTEEGFVINADRTAITVYAKSFSLYAIAYGDAAVRRFKVNLNPAENGTLSASKTTATKGTVVTITAVPYEDYGISKLTVTTANGKLIKLTKTGETTYTFVMPASTVTVSASFAADACHRDESCAYSKYTDADTLAWYHDGVHFCVERGYMAGMSEDKFGPDGTLTRAQIVTMLWNMEGKPVVDYAMSFEDVIDDFWYTEAIRWAQSNGVVEGFSDEEFKPSENVTREQLATILMNYAKFKGYDVSVGEDTNILSYDDAIGGISEWAIPSMQWAVGSGIITGTDNMLWAKGNATRAQAACMIQHFCENVAK